MLCVFAASTLILTLGEGEFSLAWSHSVTRDTWLETWHATDQHLEIRSAEVRGPGAGLEIPDTAIRTPQGWRFTPQVPKQTQLALAASGSTGGGWQICQSGSCHEIGHQPGETLYLRALSDCSHPLPQQP